MPGDFSQQFSKVIEKGRQDIITPPGVGCEERPIISQPQCGRCRRIVTGRALWRLLAASTQLVQAEQ